jgi:predicted enzyme related to lactoylglutathione lyase
MNTRRNHRFMLLNNSKSSGWCRTYLAHLHWHAAASLLGALLSFAATGQEFPPLTTVSGSPRLPGKFVWADLVTDDVPSAQMFYTRLFGWRFRDLGGYIIGSNEERPVCGMFQHARPKDKPAQPRWFGFISVRNVEKVERAVVKAGGRTIAQPRKFPKRGEQAVFADPEGALFGVVKSSSGDPEDFKPGVGDWIWIQFMSRDGRKAAEFYREIGGYEIIENTVPDKQSDYVLAAEGYARATIRTIPKERPEVLPTWLPFVRVKNAMESAKLATQLGGKVLLEPKPELLEGKVAVVADPTGGAIGVLEWSESLLKGGQ